MKDVRIKINNIVNDYLGKGDVSNENANCLWTPNGLLYAVGGAALEKDNLARLENEGFGELAELHRQGGVHIHDLALGFTSPYCAGNSLPNLLTDGIQAGMVSSAPAKHFRTAVNHMINFIGAASNEFAGAQAFNDIDIYLAPYAYKAFLDLALSGNIEDGEAVRLANREVKQSIQELIFHLNYNNRWGAQAPFSNITLAITCPDDLKGQTATVGGKPLSHYYNDKHRPMLENVTYGKLGMWQQMVVDAILDVFLEGDDSGKGFTFPVMTINVTEDFFEHPARKKIFELAGRYGTPHFQNFISGVSGGQRINPKDVRSMCCRLNLDKREIQKHIGGLFGNAEQTGSLQVVTVCLPYLAQKIIKFGGTNADFFAKLKHWMGMIRDEQVWKRQVIDDYFEKGFFPTAKANFKRGFKTFFTTIGFIGLWEAVEVLTKNDASFLTDAGMELAQEILQFMADECGRFTEQTGCLFNLEATPAEGACYKLAKKALKKYPDIPHRGTKKAPYFTNSCHLPVEMQGDLDLIFATQGKLQTIPSGGTVVHFYTGEDMSGERAEQVVRFICENTPLPFFSLTTTYSICPICGRVPGLHEYCPNEHTEAQLVQLQGERPELIER